MGKWFEAVRVVCWGTVLAWASIPGATWSQTVRPELGLAAPTEIDRVLRDGSNLEGQARWGEALAIYEEALRKHPRRPELTDRQARARLHYEIARRYSDSSFLNSLRTFSERDALALYEDVLLKIHAHYVDQPNWNAFLRKGCRALEIACMEPAFQHQHPGRADEEAVRVFLAELARTWDHRPIRNRHESREAVLQVAHSAESRLGVPSNAVILEFACAAAASLDEYSSFLTANQLDEIMSQIEGNFVGVGIELKSEPDHLLIVSVIPGGPADRSGIRAGDQIREVDGQPIGTISADAAADMLKGEEGTSVQLVVRRGEALPREVRVPRQVVEVPSVENAAVLDPSSGVAYLKLASFQKTTSRDVEAALWKLHREGMRSLIVDVRGNPGGLLTAAVEVADKFITEGTIVSTRGRGTGEDFDYKAHLVGTWRVPLTVLLDGDSASASEIFAAAIRDSRRGTLVGERSFGKGSVQGIFPLGIGHAGLRLTTAKFFSPGGIPISGQGVQPHVQVPSAGQHRVAKIVAADQGASDFGSQDIALRTAMDVAASLAAAR